MRRQFPLEQCGWLPELFEGIGETATAALASSGTIVNLQENERLPQPHECLVRVELGLVKLSVVGSDRALTVTLYGGGDTLVAPLYHAWNRELYAITAQEASSVRLIPQSAVLEACSNNPTLARNLLRQYSFESWMMMDRLHTLAFHNLPQRLARVLINLAAMMGRQEGERVNLGLRITQDELADFAGARRETLSTVLQEMREEKVLDIRYARIDIQDFEKLQAIADYEPLPYLLRSVDQKSGVAVR